MNEKLNPLFTPWKIGNCEIKNRIVLTSMGGTDLFGWMEKNHFDKDGARFILEVAKNNAGLVMPGCQPVYNPMFGQWLYKNKKMYEDLKKWMPEFHKTGAKLFVQLTAGFGRSFTISSMMETLYTNKFLRAVSKPFMNLDKITATASPSPNRWSDKVPSREMTVAEIKEFVDAFAKCAKMLKDAGYSELLECEKWEIVPGGKYYVTRNESSVIAFQIPESAFSSYQIIASHSDCPTFKVKGEDPFVTDGHYTRLNVEGYGGMIRSPWFDRPLSLAGRMVVRDGNSVKSVLVDAGRDLVTIPNLPIHLNRDINNGIKYSVQTDMLPILGDETAKDHFYELFLPDTAKEDILSMELYLYNRVEGSIWGASKEFLSSGRLDDLQSAFGSLKGFLAAKATGQVNVCAIFDNEEVGSLTKQGADSSFLTETLQHINAACGKDTIAYHRDLAGSFMVSADNAHAFHPAHAEKYDPKSRVYMNGGVVIKQSANQKYTTDAVSEAVTKMICEKAGVPCQVFANHADIPGGSTLGAILNSLVSVTSVDIGMAQLAMHSPYETAGAKDTAYLVQFAKTFYETTLVRTEHGFSLEEK